MQAPPSYDKGSNYQRLITRLLFPFFITLICCWATLWSFMIFGRMSLLVSALIFFFACFFMKVLLLRIFIGRFVWHPRNWIRWWDKNIPRGYIHNSEEIPELESWCRDNLRGNWNIDKRINVVYCDRKSDMAILLLTHFELVNITIDWFAREP